MSYTFVLNADALHYSTTPYFTIDESPEMKISQNVKIGKNVFQGT